MTLQEAVQARHSVRRFTDGRIDADTAAALSQEIDTCNREGGLAIQLCLDEPGAFSGRMASYGKFENVRNYIAVVGPKGSEGEIACGYYGERVVLRAQQLGLSTCWVVMSYSHGKAAAVGEGQKRHAVIALGYGATSGVPHTSKPMDALCEVQGDMPDWFRRGMEAVLLAPTAMNQQKFRFALSGNTVRATSARGLYTGLDLGIGKLHFEVGAGSEGWGWGE
ncbi:nitroreductase [Eubacteriales bacterium OttesenSCG-928-A19]|nr:nitroreductase [Eubacteriales bacterium OttesenSCG-928-A19]